MEEWVRRAEIAKRYGVSEYWVDRMWVMGRVRKEKRGRGVYFCVQDWEAMAAWKEAWREWWEYAAPSDPVPGPLIAGKWENRGPYGPGKGRGKARGDRAS